MRATEFEFRYRFWIIGLIFWGAFSLYPLDRVNAAVAIAQWITGGPADVHSAHFQTVVRLVFVAAAALVFVAAMIRTWGTAYLKSGVVHDLDLHNEVLVADGPYRYVRNPLYFGTLLMGVGLGLMASRLGWFVLVILLYFFHRRLIGREEAGLRKTQSQSYADYCARVPRFWPSLRPRLPAGRTRPRWKQAFLGESLIWALGVAEVLLAATLKQQVAYNGIGAALAVYAIVVFGLRRWRPKQAALPR